MQQSIAADHSGPAAGMCLLGRTMWSSWPILAWWVVGQEEKGGGGLGLEVWQRGAQRARVTQSRNVYEADYYKKQSDDRVPVKVSGGPLAAVNSFEARGAAGAGGFKAKHRRCMLHGLLSGWPRSLSTTAFIPTCPTSGPLAFFAGRFSAMRAHRTIRCLAGSETQRAPL